MPPVNHTVLIADDNAAIRQKLHLLFEQSPGWTVTEAADGREAVDKVNQAKPDVVILDLAMPQMNGLEAADRIKQLYPRLPLILFTAFADDFMAQQAHKKGFSIVIPKTDAARLVDSARLLLRPSTSPPKGMPPRH